MLRRYSVRHFITTSYIVLSADCTCRLAKATALRQTQVYEQHSLGPSRIAHGRSPAAPRQSRRFCAGGLRQPCGRRLQF